MAFGNGRLELNIKGEKMNEQHLRIGVGKPIVKGAPRRASFLAGSPEWLEPLRAITVLRGAIEHVDRRAGKDGDSVSHQAAPEAAEEAKILPAAPIRESCFVTLAQLEQLCQEKPGDYVVEGLLPAADVHVAVGDSGLGKTPLAYQLGLCVATGQPFLGHGVKQGRVLYFDLENGRDQILDLANSIRRYLEIREMPEDFLIVSDNGNPPSLAKAIKDYKPRLVIIDTLRAFRPDAEETNERMGRFLQESRSLARSNDCAILLLHHVRKPGQAKHGDNGAPPLEATQTLEWLREAAGARALINQTTTRIAFDTPQGFKANEAAFVMRYFVKIKGDSEPIYVERVCDEDGEPIGYRPMVGVELLGDEHQQDAFKKLPRQFTFKEAKHIYERADDPTRKWLLKCIAAGLIQQVGRGLYERRA